MRRWWRDVRFWFVQIPILCGPRGRCPSCQQERTRAFSPGEPGYDRLKPSIYPQPDWAKVEYRHGRQPPGEECSGCGAPPGMWQR